MPSIRAHLRPFLGSIALHAAIAVALGIAALFRFAPETPVVKTMEAYVVRAPLRENARTAPPPAAEPAPPVQEPAPVPEPAPSAEPVTEPPAPPPDPAEQQAKAEAAQREREAVDAKRRAADETRKAEAAAAAKRKAEQQAEERRKFEVQAKARAEAEARKKSEAELAERAAREADLDRRLADEAQRGSARNSGLAERYAQDIADRVERAWNRPPTAKPGLECTIYVTQVPGGAVTGAKVGECNGDEAVRQSIVSAVFRASPLPAPPDPSLFERNLTMVFAPDE